MISGQVSVCLLTAPVWFAAFSQMSLSQAPCRVCSDLQGHFQALPPLKYQGNETSFETSLWPGHKTMAAIKPPNKSLVNR